MLATGKRATRASPVVGNKNEKKPRFSGVTESGGTLINSISPKLCHPCAVRRGIHQPGGRQHIARGDAASAAETPGIEQKNIESPVKRGDSLTNNSGSFLICLYATACPRKAVAAVFTGLRFYLFL